MIEIVKYEQSDRAGKRFKATIKQNGKTYVIHHGDSERESYPYHKDHDRKIRYMKRHLRHLNKKFTKLTPAILSTCILWSYPSLKKSLSAFKTQLTNTEKPLITDLELWDELRKSYPEKSKGAISNIYKNTFKRLYNSDNSHIKLNPA